VSPRPPPSPIVVDDSSDTDTSHSRESSPAASDILEQTTKHIPLTVIRSDEIISAQKRDKVTKDIISWLTNKKGPEPVPGAKEFVVSNQVLYSPKFDIRTSGKVLRIFVPTEMRNRVIEAAHTVGHVAYDATIHTLENFAYWPSFRRDTKAFIDKCLICKEKSSGTTNQMLGDLPTPPHPWHTVGMDLLQLPVTKREHKYLLVLVDILTRYAAAIPLIDKSARQVTTALKRFILNDRLLGSPVILVSDNGLEFRNNSMTRLLRRHGVKQVCTTPYNPKGNGTTERLNWTLMSLLRGAISPNVEWDTLYYPR